MLRYAKNTFSLSKGPSFHLPITLALGVGQVRERGLLNGQQMVSVFAHVPGCISGSWLLALLDIYASWWLMGLFCRLLL